VVEPGGFMAYPEGFRGGVRVAALDVDGDGQAEILTGAGPGGGPHVRAIGPGLAEAASLFAYDPRFTGGVTVAGAE